MATRWKPTVKAKQAAADSSIIDDWENDEGEQSNASAGAADDLDTAKESSQDAWPSLGSTAAPSKASRSGPPVTLLSARSKSSSSTSSQSASPASSSSQIAPFPFSIAPRVTGPPSNLPPSALAPEPAPQILRRDPNSSASSSRAGSGSSSADGDAASRRKTLQEREREYEEARRRIFGDVPVKESTALKAGEGKSQADGSTDKRRVGRRGGSRSGSRSGDGLQKSRSGTSTPEVRTVEGAAR